MDGNVCLYTQRINHGQSKIWLGDGTTELTERRLIASNEVRNVVQRLCPEAFGSFYENLYARLHYVATLDVPNISDVATELKLK